MKKTKPGTRALIRKYLAHLKAEEYLELLWIEKEIAKRIGTGNAVVVDNKVISAHETKDAEAILSHWISISKRISIDKEDSEIAKVETPYNDLDSDDKEVEEQVEVPKKEKKKKEKRVRKKPVMV